MEACFTIGHQGYDYIIHGHAVEKMQLLLNIMNNLNTHSLDLEDRWSYHQVACLVRYSNTKKLSNEDILDQLIIADYFGYYEFIDQLAYMLSHQQPTTEMIKAVIKLQNKERILVRFSLCHLPAVYHSYGFVKQWIRVNSDRDFGFVKYKTYIGNHHDMQIRCYDSEDMLHLYQLSWNIIAERIYQGYYLHGELIHSVSFDTGGRIIDMK
jgi:hypothetical protein